ncbi:glutamyl-tRNA reductase [Pelodictyon luteolum]|uniref:Glutamyl-tRNA reductase n=1 Tax=Chlorobium luteolum (strain DSM 273 / BCRC 81028 / 2530) TaxID=319225 RepID=HEM1_CHLL3|nr:glutamyl-tRNA reductase [Pelodictyon luteolum]Q3B2Z6.1 RecName: Full=Glutamyl-tRNA reductase; Short=GluTR [Pelodictyon luteolum DSM 273]ABB24285.1 glutamyl-tRNA reductase [Pelodictyon luteolum DSM 273]
MNIISVGVNHKTAPIEIRERISLSEVQNKEFITGLISGGLAHEAMVLSTCNRTELYVVPAMHEVTGEYLKDYIISFRDARKDVRPEHFFSRFYCGTARHLFEVSSAIDSLILGEGQILGQVKEAYRIAAEVQAAGILITRLCHTAFSVAKKVKTKTKIMEGAVSVSYAAVELAQKIFSNLSMKKILLVGAGETGELAAKHMFAKNARNIVITNRTQSKAEALAEELGTNRVLPFESYKEHLHEFDIIITAVSTKDYIITEADMHGAMQKRRLKPVIILDLGLPRNADPEIGKLQNMFLKDIDALKHIIDKNLERRSLELPKVHSIIDEELVAFGQWINTLKVRPTIVDLQSKFIEIKEKELERYRYKVSEEELRRMEHLTDRIMKKILHHPIKMLKAPISTSDNMPSRVDLVRNVFDLEEPNQSH